MTIQLFRALRIATSSRGGGACFRDRSMSLPTTTGMCHMFHAYVPNVSSIFTWSKSKAQVDFESMEWDGVGRDLGSVFERTNFSIYISLAKVAKVRFSRRKGKECKVMWHVLTPECPECHVSFVPKNVPSSYIIHVCKAQVEFESMKRGGR